MARAAVRVGRVWQARERTLEVEEKDAVPLSFEAGETRLHGPAPLRVVGADVAGLRVFDWGKAEKDLCWRTVPSRVNSGNAAESARSSAAAVINRYAMCLEVEDPRRY